MSMKIGNTRQLGQTTGKRSASVRTGSGFAPEGAEEGRGVARLSGPASLTAVDALLALQEAGGVDDALNSPRRAIARGEQMLDMLDDIKVALLSGQVPQAKLERLVRAVEAQQGKVKDPELANILDHIELRARVELAKFGSYPKD
jgi:hypothetical protein